MLGKYEFGIVSLLNKNEGYLVNFQDSQIENFALGPRREVEQTGATVSRGTSEGPVRLPVLQVGRGQEAVLPHVGGGGRRDQRRGYLKGFVQRKVVTTSS